MWRPLAVLVLGLAFVGCAHPQRARGWDACVQTGSELIQIGPTWTVRPGIGEVLTLQAFWRQPLRLRQGLLGLRLPRPRVGETVIEPHDWGFYLEDAGGRRFDSTVLVGEIEPLAMAPGKVRLRVDVVAMWPTVDLDKLGNVQIQGIVEAPRGASSCALRRGALSRGFGLLTSPTAPVSIASTGRPARP